MAKFVQHPINDNYVVRDNKEQLAVLGVSQVFVGVENPNRTEILKNKDGLNYSRNAVEAQEIYNLHKQKHRCWFILDLETGSKGWYPGCEIHGEIHGFFEIKAKPSEDSETLFSGEDVILKILDIDEPKEIPENNYYKVTHNNIVGFVYLNKITNINYADPF